MGKPFSKIKRYSLGGVVARCVNSGRWEIHPHCKRRQQQRQVDLFEIQEVLFQGRFAKELWKPDAEPPDCWWYTFEGVVDERSLRVVVYFLEKEDEPHLVVYTCMVSSGRKD